MLAMPVSSSDKHGGLQQQTLPPLQVLSFQASITDTDTILLSQVDANGATFPLFSYTAAKKSVSLTRVGAGSTIVQPIPVGNVEFHTFSHTDLLTGGLNLQMKDRDGADGYKIDHPRFGKLKWNEKREKEASVLEDAQETRIARFKPLGKGKGKGVMGAFLEVYVPAEDHFLDFVVLFAIAMVGKSEKYSSQGTVAGIEAAGNIIGAMGGGGGA